MKRFLTLLILTGFLTKVLPYNGQSMGWGHWKETAAHIVMLFFDI